MCERSTKKEDEAARALGLLGLCARAGKLVIGTPLVCDALALHKLKLVIMAAGASENTAKRLRDKCAYYGVPLYTLEISTDSLAHALGKSGDTAAVGVSNSHFADGLASLWK